MPLKKIDTGFGLRENAPLPPGTFKVVAPSREYNGVTMGVQFKNGIGYTQDRAVANRLTWDFHYETQEVTAGTGTPDAARMLHLAGVISREDLVQRHLTKLEYGLDRAEAAVMGAGEAWLRGRVREIVELVPLHG